MRFAGQTLTFDELFGTIEKVTGKHISVTFTSLEESYAKDKSLLEQKDNPMAQIFYKYESLKRVVGFGDVFINNPMNGDYTEIKPVTWEEAVETFLSSK